MNKNMSLRRVVENEAIFRQRNEKVQKGLKEATKLASSEGYLTPSLEKLVLRFYCECSDENCKLRIPIRSSQYSAIHKNRRQFTVAPGHEVVSIEKIITKTPDYIVVEKIVNAPEKPKKLNKTFIDNV